MPYTFTQEDFSKFSEDIINAGGDQATVTSILADMQGTVIDAIAKDITQTEKVTTIEAENERLRKANMDLFLRVGSQAAQSLPGQTTPDQNEEPKNTSEYMKSYFEKLEE